MSRTSAPRSMSTLATLFAGQGSAANVSGSVNENVGFRFVLDRTVQTLSTNGIPDSGSTSGLLFVPSLAAEDPCSDLAAGLVPKNVTRHEDIESFGYPAIGIAPWISVACTQSFLAASRGAESDALLFFQAFNNESGIPPPATDVFWDLNDGEQWKEDNHFPVYAIPGPAAATLMRELAWCSDGKTDRSHTESYPSIQKRDSTIRLFTMIANETQKDSWPLWIVAGIALVSIIALGLTIWFTWSAISRRLIRQIRAQREQRDVESVSMDRRTPAVVPREVVGQLPLYTYAGPRSPPSVVSLVKDEIETHVEEIVFSIQSPEPPIQEAHVKLPQNIQNTEDSQDTHGTQEAQRTQETNRVVGIRRPTPAVINPGSGGIIASANPYRMSHTQTTCAICFDAFVIGSSSIRELPCGHIFDRACIDEWLLTRNSECPLCKMSVLSSSSVYAATTQGA